MAIHFHSEQIDFPDIDKKSIKNWIKTVIDSHKSKVGDLNYIFTSDENILAINNKYLEHNYYTDVITFDYTENKVISGDIFISLETVKTNSEKFEQAYPQELKRVIIHGVLHLIGFKDKTEPDAKEMRKQEDNALKKQG